MENIKTSSRDLVTENDENIRRQKLLDEVLKEILSGNSELNDEGGVEYLIEKFKRVYLDDKGHQVFRHGYSQVTNAIVAEAQKDLRKMPDRRLGRIGRFNEGQRIGAKVSESSSMLGEYLSRVLQKIVTDGPDALYEPINKLHDHVTLEQVRTDLLLRTSQDAEYNMRESVMELEDAKHHIDELESEIRAEDAKLNSMQKEYIAILGIFSAVALISNGGISLGNAAVSAASSYDILCGAFLISLVSLFIFNLFYALMSFVFRTVNTTQDSAENADEDEHPIKTWLNSTGVMNHKAYAIINGVMIALIVALFISALATAAPTS